MRESNVLEGSLEGLLDSLLSFGLKGSLILILQLLVDFFKALQEIYELYP